MGGLHKIISIKMFLCIAFVFSGFSVSGQVSADSMAVKTAKHVKYLDDQLYASFSYNIITAKPDGLSVYGLPNSFAFGYIRDMPVNSRRNFGFGVGLGLNFSACYSNLQMINTPEGLSQTGFLKQGTYKKNFFSTQSLELPLQIRYRTSTASSFDFWRFYAGITPSWVFKNYSTYNNNLVQSRYYNIGHIANFLCSANLQVGYGKFNIRADYTFTPLFDSTDEMKALGMQKAGSVSIGLLIYFI